MSHSTSLRAAGSEMSAAMPDALLAPPLRSASIALLTSAMSASEVSGAGPGASGICATALFCEADLSSFDLPATFFPADLTALAADLTVAADELEVEFLAEPLAARASAARVTASRLAQASAATNAERYRV